VFFMPYHLCKKLDIRVRTFVRESYTLPVLLCVPLAAVLLLMRRWYVPHNYRGLGLQLLIAALVYGAGLLWAVLSKRALHVSKLALSGRSTPVESGVMAAPEQMLP
jgi:hypothetical protein